MFLFIIVIVVSVSGASVISVHASESDPGNDNPGAGAVTAIPKKEKDDEQETKPPPAESEAQKGERVGSWVQSTAGTTSGQYRKIAIEGAIARINQHVIASRKKSESASSSEVGQQSFMSPGASLTGNESLEVSFRSKLVTPHNTPDFGPLYSDESVEEAYRHHQVSSKGSFTPDSDKRHHWRHQAESGNEEN